MKQLDKEFIGTGIVKGFVFKHIKNNGFVYLYEVNTGDSIHWEVFEHRESKEMDTVIGGVEVHFDAKVTYPSINSFGDWAYCCNSLDKALQRFDSLTITVKSRIENQLLKNK